MSIPTEQQLEERFGQDLTEQKGAIKEITIHVLSEREAGEEEEEEEEDDEEGSSSGSDSSDEEEAADVESMPKAKRKGGGGFNKEYAWSEDMAAFLGQGYASRAQVRGEGVPLAKLMRLALVGCLWFSVFSPTLTFMHRPSNTINTPGDQGLVGLHQGARPAEPQRQAADPV